MKLAEQEKEQRKPYLSLIFYGVFLLIGLRKQDGGTNWSSDRFFYSSDSTPEAERVRVEKKLPRNKCFDRVCQRRVRRKEMT